MQRILIILTLSLGALFLASGFVIDLAFGAVVDLSNQSRVSALAKDGVPSLANGFVSTLAMFEPCDDAATLLDFLEVSQEEWYTHPSGSTDLPKDLASWKKNSNSKELDGTMAQAFATRFLKNFVSIIQPFAVDQLIAQTKKGLGEGKESGWQEAVDSFVFNSGEWYTGGDLAPGQLLNNYVTASLRYFLKEVVADDLLARLRAAYLQADHPETMTWVEVVKTLGTFRAPDPLVLLQYAAENLRKPGMNLVDWVAHNIILRKALATCDISFGEPVWIRLLLARTTNTERNLLDGNVKTVDEFQQEVLRITAEFALRGATLPGWTRAQRMKNGQERRSTYSRAMDRTTKNLGGFAWEPECSHCGRDNHPSQLCRYKRSSSRNGEKKAEKKAEKKPNRELQGLACPTCNKPGHTSNNCPRKGQVVSFLARVDAAEKQFA